MKAVQTIVALLLILAATLWAFGVPPLDGMKLMAEGAAGDAFGWSRTAVKSVPLLLTGLGMVVAWRAGMYNIGGEGQFLMGALLAGFLAKALLAANVPGWLGMPLLLVTSLIGGAAWSYLAGWLYVKRGVDVVIGTILLNFVALQVLAWAVNGPIRASNGVALSELLPESYMLPRVNRQLDAHAGILLAILIASLVTIYLYRTKAGFNVRLAGENPRVARANQIDANRMRLQAMLVSGALCGLAGGIEYVAMARQLGTGFSQNWGFLGIPVALLSGLHPLAAIGSATFFGALFAGSENLARFTKAGPTLIYIVQAAAVLGVVSLRALQQGKSKKKAQSANNSA